MSTSSHWLCGRPRSCWEERQAAATRGSVTPWSHSAPLPSTEPQRVGSALLGCHPFAGLRCAALPAGAFLRTRTRCMRVRSPSRHPSIATNRHRLVRRLAVIPRAGLPLRPAGAVRCGTSNAAGDSDLKHCVHVHLPCGVPSAR